MALRAISRWEGRGRIGLCAGAESYLRAGFKFWSTKIAPFPVVFWLPRLVGEKTIRNRFAMRLASMAGFVIGVTHRRPRSPVLLRGINGHAAGE